MEADTPFPPRYNRFNEWKPIVYRGNTKQFEEEARAASDDPDVQGVLFYMKCTRYHVIEFVISASVEIPVDGITFGRRLHIYKCPRRYGEATPFQQTWIYDGCFEVGSDDPEAIRIGIAEIQRAASRLALFFDSDVRWQVKYSMASASASSGKPSKEDLKKMTDVFQHERDDQEARILDSGIDWHIRGNSSRNLFTRFLCHYIAVESVANAIHECGVDFGIGYRRERRDEREAEAGEFLRNQSPFPSPLLTIKDAYFEYVVAIKRRVQQVTKLVFGADHRFVQAMFTNRDGMSLTDMRAAIAHGRLTLGDTEDEKLVRSRLHEMAAIAKAFLMRLVLRLSPTESVPSWSKRFRVAFTPADPRNITCVSSLRHSGQRDWTIRPEWCD